MKSQSTAQIKKTLLEMEPVELTQLMLRLLKYKKDNKELVSYVLYNSKDEEDFIEQIKSEIDELIEAVKHENSYRLTKQIRKILRTIQKPIKYSGIPYTHVELLVYFCEKIKKYIIHHNHSTVLRNIYLRQLEIIEKTKLKMHEDLQYDYKNRLLDLYDI
jgi:mevalonate kinase